MGDVVGFPREEASGNLACACGGEWFELKTNVSHIPHGALCFALDGHVSGFAGTPHCIECGRVRTLPLEG